MGTPSILIFTNKSFPKLSGFALISSFGVLFGNSDDSFEGLLLARFFLNDRIGGHPTTGASAALLVSSQQSETKKDKHQTLSSKIIQVNRAFYPSYYLVHISN